MEIYIDGGITVGTDVFKAVALGAKMVNKILINFLLINMKKINKYLNSQTFIGRPMLWAMACEGEIGAKNLLELLKKEIHLTFALSGIVKNKKIIFLFYDYVAKILKTKK